LKEEEKIRKFNELVPKAARVHAYTWCVRRQCAIPTISLKGEECVRCKEFVLNGGVCDPL